MISIDRNAAAPLHVQVAEQVRYAIATGQYATGERLPSTRVLASRLGVSYHTVRAAYRLLESDGLVRGGSRYRVRSDPTIARADRMEQGAKVVHDALRRLVGMGLEPDEMEYLYQEQMELLTQDGQEGKLIFAGLSLELAALCAQQLAETLHRSVDAVRLGELSRHQDADFIFAAYDHVRGAMDQAPRADVRGVSVHLNEEALERVTRLLDEHTLCIVSLDDDSIPPLVDAVRAEAGFGGQMMASSVRVDDERLTRLTAQSTLVLYTPPVRRSLLPHLQGAVPGVVVRPVISPSSLAAVRKSLS